MRTIRTLLLLMMTWASLYAQSSAINGSIEGTVMDPSGAAVSGATVEVVNTATGFRRSVVTDSSGVYRFTLLPLGPYEVVCKAAGFNEVKNTGVVLNAGSTATVDLQLSLGTAATTVQVSDTTPVTEPGKTDLGYVLSTNAMVNLPLVTRNTYNFILVQPNVSGHPQNSFGVPRKVNANGFAGRINYQLDGNNNTQSDRAGIRLMPLSNSFLGEVQQVSNGFAPEFGNTVGTVFNAVTRSGTNEFHGEMAYIFRRGDFNARPPLASIKAPGFLDSGFINGGGKIIKDKLFFFAAYERVRNDLSAAVTVAPSTLTALGLPQSWGTFVPTVENPAFFFVRTDWQINQKNLFVFRYNHFRNEQPFNNASGLTVQSQSVLFWDRVHAGAMQLISTITPTLVNEFRAQLPYRNQQNRYYENSGAGPALTITGLINFGGPTVAGFRFIETAPDFSDNLSWTKGKHSFKFGASFRTIFDRNTQATFAQYTFASLAAYQAAVSGVNRKSYANFTQTVGQAELVYQTLFSSYYFQDNWKVTPRLTLTYGLRYDLYRPPDADKTSPYEPSRSFETDKNNFAPRFGFAYALDKAQKTVIRGNAGVFFDPPQVDVYRRAILNNGNPLFFNVSTGPTAAFAPNFPDVFTGVPGGFQVPVRDVIGVSPNFRTLYSSNWNVQISREITSNTSVSVSYLGTKGTRLPIYRNINLIPSGTFLADGRPIFGSGRLDTRFNNISIAESVGNSIYHGMTAQLNRRFRAGLELFATWTWSKAIDDAPEQNNLDSGSSWLSDPTNRRRDRGLSFVDRTHVFIFSGVWNPTYSGSNGFMKALASNNQFSWIFSARSGDVFNVGSNRVLNNDPTITSAFQRPLYIGRNTVRGPEINHLDLRYARSFPIKERFRLEALAESSNLFNHTNITGLNTGATVDAAGNILTQPNLLRTASLPPRQIQFGVRFRY
jgi:hypothetical protein